MSTSLVSSYFVMLYGLSYGYARSVDWLVSFLTAFFQSALVQQPIKVVCLAVILTLIFKKPAEMESIGLDVELGGKSLKSLLFLVWYGNHSNN
jgi:hypothetical protein